jgi:hypothetical protein
MCVVPMQELSKVFNGRNEQWGVEWTLSSFAQERRKKNEAGWAEESRIGRSLTLEALADAAGAKQGRRSRLISTLDKRDSSLQNLA